MIGKILKPGNRFKALAHQVKPDFLLVASIFIIALTLLIPLSPDAGWALTGREVMQKVNDRDDGDNQVTELEMVLIDKKGKKRIRSIRSFRKDYGKDSKTIMFFLTPADMKNSAFLTFDYDQSGKDDDQWLYLPALRKTKRIAGSDQSGAFMGSDFNYSDMSSPDLDDFTYKIMKETEIKGVKTWQIESKPKTPDISEETGYSKSVAWVRQDNFMTIRAVRWVYKSKRMKFMQIKKLKQIDNIWVSMEMEMKTKEGRATVHSTVLYFNEIKFNQKLSDSMFTTRRLEKGL